MAAARSQASERGRRPVLSTKRSAGQSSLATYFTTSNKAPSGSDALKAGSRPSETISATSNELEPADIPSTFLDTPDEVPLPQPRLPLQIIPSSLANHRLAPLNTTRSRLPPPEDMAMSAKHYTFLSSSPPKAPKNDPGNGTTDSIQPATEVKENACATKAATTFHTTSVQQVTARKTLGVKRSMNGWAERGKSTGGFQVPKRVGKG